jgi:hypothetical protein
MGMSRIGRFVAAIRLSAARAEADAVHCVQALETAPGLSYFIISVSGEEVHPAWQRDPYLPVSTADRVGCCFKTEGGKGSWTTIIELSQLVASVFTIAIARQLFASASRCKTETGGVCDDAGGPFGRKLWCRQLRASGHSKANSASCSLSG